MEDKHCVVCIGNVGFKIFIMEVILSPSLTSKLLSAKFVCFKAAALLEETSVKCKNPLAFGCTFEALGKDLPDHHIRCEFQQVLRLILSYIELFMI